MALQLSVETVHGFIANDAYHRVEGVQLIGKTAIAFRLRSYKQAQGLPHFSDQPFECAYDLNGPNPIAQAYAHLKALPEFAGAVDC
jgi:hypothetical protein